MLYVLGKRYENSINTKCNKQIKTYIKFLKFSKDLKNLGY